MIIKEFSLHTLKLNVTDSIYADIISLLQKYPNSEAYIIQDENESDFILNDKDEAKQRIERARKSIAQGNYIEEDTFWSQMDNHININIYQ